MPSNLNLYLLESEELPALISTFTFPWSSFQATQEKWERYYSEQQAKIRKVCIAKIGNDLVGYGSLLKHSEYPDFKKLNIPEIHDVWISEKYRGNGYGRKLIQYLEEIALKGHHKQIGIGVGLYKDYGFAQKLYVRMGYIPDGNGITYNYQPVKAGDSYPVDDDLLLWFKKDFSV